MLVPMTKVHVIGHRRRLHPTLEALHLLSAVQLIDVTDDSSITLPPLTADDEQVQEIEELRYLRARLDALLALSSDPPPADTAPVDLALIRSDLETTAPEIESLARSLEERQLEISTLPRHVQSLKRLLPLVPELTELESYDTDAVILDARHASVLGDLSVALDEVLEGNFEIISDQVDTDTVGAVIVTPKKSASEVLAILGRQQVNRVRLPHEYESVPFRKAITLMERRLADLPVEMATIEDKITAVMRSRGAWVTARSDVTQRLGQLSAIRHLGATPQTFVLSGWVPAPRLEEVRRVVASVGQGEVIVELAPIGDDEEPPILLQNREAVRPFEALVSLLSMPRYGSLDPTTLTMVFLPLFFGMMLGDIAYGILLLALALYLRHRFRVTSPSAAEFLKILVLGAGWTIVWGVLYGEFLGDLGRRWFGLEPIWINREEAIEPLLIFALAVGIAHITLGLVLGIWTAAHRHDRKKLSTSVGTLLALIGLFGITGVAVGQLPDGWMTPAVATIVVGTVLMIALEGPMGLITGPLELLGLVGNVLSYLRIAAIGIASVYLARVANELGSLGPLWFGIIVAALFHALNLALGVFSPSVQALRLHYVEFFGKFYEGGGTAFVPFGSLDRKE